MNTINIIFKGIILWISAFFIALTIVAIDSFSLGQILLIAPIEILFALIILSHLTIEEIQLLSGYKLIDKLIKK